MKDEITSDTGRGTFSSYLAGFLLSLLFTISAYLLVVVHFLTSLWLIAAIILLGVAQLLVQLIFFLHLGKESKPRWNLMVLSFAGVVLLILVFGSLWIMNNLNYHMATPHDIDKAIMNDEGIHE
jgi:cytochrome o ubiquinol oxidase subunit IV